MRGARRSGVLSEERNIWLVFQKSSTSKLPICFCGGRASVQTEEKAMNEHSASTEGIDTDELVFECPDEAIEAAANAGMFAAGAITLSFCSGLDSCPA